MTYKDAKRITHNPTTGRLDNIIATLQLMQWQDEAQTRREMRAARLLRDEKRAEMRRAALRRHTLGYDGRTLAG